MHMGQGGFWDRSPVQNPPLIPSKEGLEGPCKRVKNILQMLLKKLI